MTPMQWLSHPLIAGSSPRTSVFHMVYMLVVVEEDMLSIFLLCPYGRNVNMFILLSVSLFLSLSRSLSLPLFLFPKCITIQSSP